MPKRTNRKDPLGSRNPLTPEEAGRLADAIGWSLDYDGDDLGRLLLLIHAFVYEPDATTRETILIEAQTKLAVYLLGFDELAQATMRRQLDALKGGAR